MTAHLLIANNLLTGETVFMGADGWVQDHRQALIVQDETAAAALGAQGKSEMRSNIVVDAYLVEVEIGADGIVEPVHYREKMRTRGPSNRVDLGKQAELIGLEPYKAAKAADIPS